MPQPKQTPSGDPTITSRKVAAGDPYPEGTHPARPASEVHHAADKIEYREAPDKPDKTSVAQVADVPDDWFGDGR
jgi:hypothetical protein